MSDTPPLANTPLRSAAGIAVDPGITGAYAIFDAEDGALAYNTPVLTVTKSRKTMDLRTLHSHLVHYKGTPMILEEVSAMPQQGVVSMFNFGKNVGQWEMLAAALEMPLYRVRPQVWKKEFGLLKKPKDAALRIATELFQNFTAAKKKDVNRADALLIGEYARRNLL